MKQNNVIIGIGAVIIALLMVLTATAVPQVQSKTVMNQIEKKEDFINQLIAVYDQLEKDGVVATENQELQKNTKITPDFYQSFYVDADERYHPRGWALRQIKSLGWEGFITYITSDEFIILLEENYNDIISDNGFQYLWNSEYVQKYLHSDEFINFMNTDEIQYILDNLDIENQQVIQTHALNMTHFDDTLKGNVIPFSEETQSTTDLLTAWIIIIIGFLTWIPGILLVIVTAPIYFLYGWLFGMYMIFINTGWPFPFVFALAALVATMAYVIVNVTCWPVIWYAFFEWWVPPI